MVTIVDCGIGNLGSIQNMLRKVGVAATISSNPAAVRAAEKLILPGVGSFDYGMERLHQAGLIPALNEKVLDQHTPILGICLGAQMMTRGSEEGKLPGLGWIEAETIRFHPDVVAHGLKIPHMGWNEVHMQKVSALFKEMAPNPRFYFVHSYHFSCKDKENVLTMTHYDYDFASSFEKGNIAGVQFHPEKSHKFGLQLLKNFAER